MVLRSSIWTDSTSSDLVTFQRSRNDVFTYSSKQWPYDDDGRNLAGCTTSHDSKLGTTNVMCYGETGDERFVSAPSRGFTKTSLSSFR